MPNSGDKTAAAGRPSGFQAHGPRPGCRAPPHPLRTLGPCKGRTGTSKDTQVLSFQSPGHHFRAPVLQDLRHVLL